MWAGVPVDAAAVSAALDGKAQIKVEQKCWGYHAHTTKIDAERVKWRARQHRLEDGREDVCAGKEQKKTDRRVIKLANKSDGIPTGSIVSPDGPTTQGWQQ